jgi:glycosyltransferase involved in cell wall biosynthesis
MRVLQICFRMPYPLKDGGAIAMFNVSKGLHDQNVENTLLIPVTEKHNVTIDELPDEVLKLGDFHEVKIKSKPTIFGALINILFSKKPYYLSRYISTLFEEKLISLLNDKQFDTIIFESLKVSMYLDTARKYSKAKMILRSHNVEYLIWDRLRQKSRFLKKLYLENLVKRIKKFELGILNNFDGVATITEVDENSYNKDGLSKPSFNLASGIDLIKYKTDYSQIEDNSLFHIGSLDWIPNQEAVIWFIEEVWPLIKEEFPELKFYLAGRNIPEWMKKYSKNNVHVIGEVEDAIDFINSKEIMIVPLLSGSGLRIKVMEGLALGKTIISTSIGAEGINYTNGQNILIADNPETFLKTIRKLVAEPALKADIGKNARTLIENEYDNQLLINRFLDWLKQL